MLSPDQLKALWPSFAELVEQAPEQWERILSVDLPEDLARERDQMIERTGALYEMCAQLGWDWWRLGEKIWSRAQTVQ